MFRFIE